MEVFTIGFTRKTAAEFFEILQKKGIKRLLDVRLNNKSQLAGFTKFTDLKYFLKKICDIDYMYESKLAPTAMILNEYKKKKGSWEQYEKKFLLLMHERKIEDKITPSFFTVPTVLLCSETTAEKCHRRLVLEYLKEKWNKTDMKIIHL